MKRTSNTQDSQIRQWNAVTRSPYSMLLLVLILHWMLFAILPPLPAEKVSAILLLVIVGLVLKVSIRNKRLLAFYISTAIAASGIQFLYALGFHENSIEIGLLATSNGVYAAFLLMSIYLTVVGIFSNLEVTIDTVIGGICIFLLIGFFWVFVYETVYLIDGGSLAGPGDPLTEYDLIYFSFTTLTTVGYGEITPVANIVKFAANLESVIGIIFPATFIAMLVNSYQART